MDEGAWNSEWYREKATNQEVTALLDGKPDGSFYVRDSTSEPGSFVLSYRYGMVWYGMTVLLIVMPYNQMQMYFIIYNFPSFRLNQ